MKQFLQLLVALLVPSLLMAQAVQAPVAESISETNAVKLKQLALERVKQYTAFLELIAKAKPDEEEETEAYRNRLFELVEKPDMVVFQDLFPEKFRENARTIDLKTYLTDFATYYSGAPELDYAQFQVSPVYYDAVQKRFFLKVSVLRSIKGRFRSQGKLTPHLSTERLDFYVAASVLNQKANLNRIFNVDEHKENENQFKALKVVNPPPLIFLNMATRYKRGKEYEVSWSGGFKGEIVKVGLYKLAKDGTIVAVDSSIYNGDNSNAFVMDLPVKLKPGQYLLRIDNTNGLKEPISSLSFQVKRKIPLVAKLTAGALVGTIIYMIWPQTTVSNDIADPFMP